MTEDMKPELNTDLVSRVLEQIDAHPETWDQRTWFGESDNSCGTTACFAGWAALLTGWKQVNAISVTRDGIRDSALDVATRELGLTRKAADALFTGSNTREDLDRILDAVKNGQESILLTRSSCGTTGCESCGSETFPHRLR